MNVMSICDEWYLRVHQLLAVQVSVGADGLVESLLLLELRFVGGDLLTQFLCLQLLQLQLLKKLSSESTTQVLRSINTYAATTTTVGYRIKRKRIRKYCGNQDFTVI